MLDFRIGLLLLVPVAAFTSAEGTGESLDHGFEKTLLLSAAVSPTEGSLQDEILSGAVQFSSSDLTMNLDLGVFQDEEPSEQPDVPEDIPVSVAAEDSELARKAQNPIADLISLPFQYNLNFNVGTNDDPQQILNIQPVYPINLSDDWNLITRTIIPLIDQPALYPGDDSNFGLGDVQFTGFFSPAKSEGVTWGIGPAFRLPTATSRNLGTDKWSAGPSLVVLDSSGPWVFGALLQNVWSYAGSSDRADVNEFLLQPFVNYNLDDGWYLTTSPIMTANWEADSDNRWMVPLGGGVGRVFNIGKQPVNLQMQGYYNVVRPDEASNWGLRIQLQFLFPK